MKRGISLVALIATVVILSIIVTTMVISGITSSDNAKKIAFGSEISFVQETVNAYYASKSELPVSDLIQVDTTMINQSNISEQFVSENIVNGKLSLYALDYTKLGITSLKYGTRINSDSTDVYAVSQTTNRVYYVKGLKIASKVYFTLTNDLKQTVSYSSNSTSSFVKNGIYFIPNETSWTDKSVSVDVKVPRSYTSVLVTADKNKIGSPDTSNPDYLIYHVTKIVGNYDIVVNYTDSTGTYTVNYSVNNFDDTPPEILLDEVNQQIKKNTTAGTSYAYFTVLSKTDNASGVKVVKYENEKITTQNIETYFKTNGKIVRNDIIPIDKYVTDITVYIEDNAGNWSANWVTIDSSIYASLLNASVSSSNPGTNVFPVINVNVIATENSVISGQSAWYNNPLIPKGFKAINTTAASWNNITSDWNNGLVIQDASGNEFVWVPVDGYNVPYAKWCTVGVAYNNSLISDDTFTGGLAESDQITAYGGFYIARYEAMFDYNGGSLRVASKKSTNKTLTNWSTTRNTTYNGYLWNWINYIDAKSYSEEMASSYSYDTSKVITTLVTGTEWDTMMKWVQNSGLSVTDSRAWGNHYDSISPANIAGYGSFQVSGFSEYWKAKNIYDLAGNCWEWTSEKYSTTLVVRSGDFINYANNHPVSERGNLGASNYTNTLSFRVALFLK